MSESTEQQKLTLDEILLLSGKIKKWEEDKGPFVNDRYRGIIGKVAIGIVRNFGKNNEQDYNIWCYPRDLDELQTNLKGYYYSFGSYDTKEGAGKEKKKEIAEVYKKARDAVDLPKEQKKDKEMIKIREIFVDVKKMIYG